MPNSPETKSRLPPQTVAKMRRLNTEHLRLYANDLLGSYDGKSRKLRAVGKRLGEEWVERQGEFLEAVADELREIILSGESP